MNRFTPLYLLGGCAVASVGLAMVGVVAGADAPPPAVEAPSSTTTLFPLFLPPSRFLLPPLLPPLPLPPTVP